MVAFRAARFSYCQKARFTNNGALGVLLKWDFGEGPGRVLNGKSIAYNAADGLIYIRTVQP